jgi:hypothetical protein
VEGGDSSSGEDIWAGWLCVSPGRMKEVLERDSVVAIDCGEKHSCALTSKGRLFTWGCADDGRLGHGTKAVRGTPLALNRLSPLLTMYVCVLQFGQEDAAALGWALAESEDGDDCVEASEPRLVSFVRPPWTEAEAAAQVASGPQGTVSTTLIDRYVRC